MLAHLKRKVKKELGSLCHPLSLPIRAQCHPHKTVGCRTQGVLAQWGEGPESRPPKSSHTQTFSVSLFPAKNMILQICLTHGKPYSPAGQTKCTWRPKNIYPMLRPARDQSWGWLVVWWILVLVVVWPVHHWQGGAGVQELYTHVGRCSRRGKSCI